MKSTIPPPINTPPTASPDQAALRHFFDLVYGACGDGWLVLSYPDPAHGQKPGKPALLSHWHDLARTTLASVASDAAQLAAQGTVYHACVIQEPPCQPDRYHRGKHATAYQVPGLWFDLDLAYGAHAASALPATDQEALAFLRTLSAPPSLILHSGGGLYIWWLFKELFTITSDAERRDIAHLSKRFAHTVCEAGRQHGWTFDNTSDLARVLRPPGSINFKYGKPVLLLHEGAERYNLSDFDNWLLPLPQASHTAQTGTAVGGQFDIVAIAEAYGATLGKKSATELCGAHPVHGSSTGDNFNVNPGNGLWHCWRHGTGGDALTLIAVCENLLDCEHAIPGALTGDLFKQAVGIANQKFQAGITLGPTFTTLGNAGGVSTPQTEAPLPLRRALPPPEHYPLDALGTILGDMARLLMAVVQAPDALCAQSVLAAAALAVQAHANVILDGRSHPLSGYFLTIAESGERKSSVDTQALVAHRARQKQLHDASRDETMAYQNDADAYRKSREEALKKAKSRDEKKAALDSLGPPPAQPLEPVLLAQEPTYEGLFKLLQIGQPSLGLFSDEGGRLVGGHAMSEEHQLKTAAGLSELWDGKPISRVRAGDGTVMLYGRRVSVHLMLQPVIAPLLLGNALLSGQGFLSRCLVAWPSTTAGTRLYQAVDLRHNAVAQRYHRQLERVLQTPLPIAADTVNELDPRLLPLHAAARTTWTTFHNHIERQLGDEQPLAPIRGFASKLPEHALRLAGILTLVEDLTTPEISEAHMEAGIQLAEFYLSEALRLFHASAVDPDIVLAEKLLAWAQGFKHIYLRQIYQYGPNAIREAQTAKRIVSILEAHGWLVRIPGMVVDSAFRRDVWEVKV